MNIVPEARMSVDEFLAWAVEEPGRYELDRGVVVAMAPQSVGHAVRKAAVYNALWAGVRADGLPCHVLPDGLTVRIDAYTAYEPDALVYCGPPVPSKSVEVPNPVIVVEVWSSSTGRLDALRKMAGYFRVPSVMHYLIVDADEPLIVHHARGQGDTIVSRIASEGALGLDPPGLTVSVSEVYPAD